VQALARIIVAEQMLDIAHLGWRVVTMTHDEVVCIAKTARAKTCFTDMTRIMKTPPAWCADIPLNCEGGYASNYSK
jgi:DNA polymerase